MKVNIGCGQSPTPGWLNFDNSVSIRLSKHPYLVRILNRLKLLNSLQTENIKFHQATSIVKYANAARHIPLADESVEVLYSSHMLEHLDANQRKQFLSEAARILKPGGVIRIAVPSLELRLERYLTGNDADSFVESTGLARPALEGLKNRLLFLINGDRGHKWMYDGRSLSLLLEKSGFDDAIVLDAGETTITKPGQLDLFERENDSIYVEACKPAK